MRAGSRVAVIIVLIVSLIAAGVTRQIAESQRHKAAAYAGSSEGGESSSLSGMSSFALALLLGGLRGPLVMILWTSSENQKNEKDLESFDTKVEWIRRLQPEFDTVHIFQIWNKAYNISVQMASLSNKYTTILDALDYGHEVDAERPDNINILTSIAQVYFDKLANSAEKYYYRKRVRDESKQHPMRQKLSRNDPGWRRLELDPMLDDNGNLLPEYTQPRGPIPAELPYLAQYQPYTYGISPFALSYNYYKRSQLLQRVGKQKHAQLSDLVVDSRPALALKNWSEEEWERGRRAELDAYGIPAPGTERLDIELPSAEIKLTDKAKPDQLAAALDAYALSARLCRDARDEYADHLKHYLNNMDTYASHLDGLVAQEHLVTADHDFLAAASATGDAQKKLIDNSKKNYESAIREYVMMIFKYYCDAGAVKAIFPDGTKENMDKMPTAELLEILGRLHGFIASPARKGFDANREDREEYEKYIARSMDRLKTLGN